MRAVDHAIRSHGLRLRDWTRGTRPARPLRVVSLRCRISEAIEAKRTCRERRERVDLAKMTHKKHCPNLNPQCSSLPRCGGVLSFRWRREALAVKGRELITLLGGAVLLSFSTFMYG